MQDVHSTDYVEIRILFFCGKYSKLFFINVFFQNTCVYCLNTICEPFEKNFGKKGSLSYHNPIIQSIQ